jgi:hypothetical protein
LEGQGIKPSADQLAEILTERPVIALILMTHRGDLIEIHDGAVIVSYGAGPESTGDLLISPQLASRLKAR